MGEMEQVRWTWQSRDNDLRTGYMTVKGRVSIAELIEHMKTVATDASLEDIQVNFATVTWTRQATAEELVVRDEMNERHRQRHEAWERRTLATLMEKYKAEFRE
jgi:hypothetical protein